MTKYYNKKLKVSRWICFCLHFCKTAYSFDFETVGDKRVESRLYAKKFRGHLYIVRSEIYINGELVKVSELGH